ncbi:MAG: SpoIIIAH-like family protein [Ruminococcus sp.]|nr:SpoIIIAH-like family protein [Ruminococcus sp.]MCD7800698.1 SpoIIIAH-like family protein [Ruminococcus sp.]
MKKPSLIIGKKQIILACLTMMLGIAVYVNYILADSDGLVSPESLAQVDDISTSEDEEVDADGESYGDTEFVNVDSVENLSADGDDYFAQARLDRLTSRDNAIQTIQTAIGGGDLTNDEMVTKALEAVSISQLSESETTIETLIKATGISDCIVYLESDSAKVVVKSNGLDTKQVASIKEIILSEIDVPTENIKIMEMA